MMLHIFSQMCHTSQIKVRVTGGQGVHRNAAGRMSVVLTRLHPEVSVSPESQPSKTFCSAVGSKISLQTRSSKSVTYIQHC